MEEFGCFFCWNEKKKKEKERYYFDDANNLRLSNYCPNCGRKYGEETVNEYLESKQSNGGVVTV